MKKMELPVQIYCQDKFENYPEFKAYVENTQINHFINQLQHEVKDFIYLDAPSLILANEINDDFINKLSISIPSNELVIIHKNKCFRQQAPEGVHLLRGFKKENYDRALWTIIQYYLQRKAKKNTSKIYGTNALAYSDKIKKTMALAERVAGIDCPTCIIGETGTGKELIARTIHYQSERHNKPFIPVNCGAFNDDLILSEFFGHTKGAFTGANQPRKGLVELAEGGTLFLDEIDSLTPKGQVILLRFLQENEYRPVGGNTLKKSNVRVIAACNKDLMELSRQGLFREDLIYRINIITIDVPPLAERKEDILFLSQFFLSRLALSHEQEQKVLEPGLINFILNYRWPGNVRELENFIYKAYYLSTQQFIRGTELDIEIRDPDPFQFRLDSRKLKGFKEEKNSIIRKFELEYISKALEQSGGNISLASRIAKKERAAFYKLMKKYNISREPFVH